MRLPLGKNYVRIVAQITDYCNIYFGEKAVTAVGKRQAEQSH
jgi:hypothetical protein